MQSYVYVIFNAESGTKLGEFNSIVNALLFIEAYYYKYCGETFNLIISKQEKE